ncbi:MAG: gamma carbonic anhydrase family protein [Candidatus Sericytochromatia bacterium]
MTLKFIKDEFNIAENAFIAPNTSIVGKVTIGEHASIWYQSVLRGDTDEIIIGENSNIQDACILHCVYDFPVIVGANVSVGHGAILHGCTIGDNVLIGMRATVLTGAIIGDNCIIGAGAVVTEGTIIPDNSLVLGIPAKVKGTVSDKNLELIKMTWENYVEYSNIYINKLKSAML